LFIALPLFYQSAVSSAVFEITGNTDTGRHLPGNFIVLVVYVVTVNCGVTPNLSFTIILVKINSIDLHQLLKGNLRSP